MTVYHIVLFQFKALVPPDEDKTVSHREHEYLDRLTLSRLASAY